MPALVIPTIFSGVKLFQRQYPRKKGKNRHNVTFARTCIRKCRIESAKDKGRDTDDAGICKRLQILSPGGISPNGIVRHGASS